MNQNGVTVFCDPALAPAIRALAGGPEIAVLSAPSSLMLAQIARHTRNDVLVTLSTGMDEAVQRKLVRSETRVDGFINLLVLAGNPAMPVTKAVVAVTDNTPSSGGLDGRALLTAAGLSPKAILGAANTGDAAFLVLSGKADLALIYATDAATDPRLRVAATLPANPTLTRFAAAQNSKAMSPDALTFLNFLRSPAAKQSLYSAGLMVTA